MSSGFHTLSCYVSYVILLFFTVQKFSINNAVTKNSFLPDPLPFPYIVYDII